MPGGRLREGPNLLPAFFCENWRGRVSQQHRCDFPKGLLGERDLPPASASRSRAESFWNLKHAVPAAPLVEVDISPGGHRRTRAPRAVDPAAAPTFPARLELGLTFGTSRLHFSSPSHSSYATRPEPATLRAKLHRALTSVVVVKANAFWYYRRLAALLVWSGTSDLGKER